MNLGDLGFLLTADEAGDNKLESIKLECFSVGGTLSRIMYKIKEKNKINFSILLISSFDKFI
jgi:hypothetical protein